MKRQHQLSLAVTALAVSLAVVGSTRADTTITTFDNFTPNALYASWSTATINATPTNYIISNAFKYGSLWKQLGPPPLNAAGNTNLVLDVTLDAANPAAAAAALTVVVDLKDGQAGGNSSFGYRFHGLSPGHHLLVGNLFSTNVPATDNGTILNFYEIYTNSANPTTHTLDLSQLWHLNVELDPTSYTNSGNTYNVALNDLTLTGSGGGGSLTNVCAVVSTFDNFNLAGTMGSWGAGVSTATNFQITAAGWGGGWAPISPALALSSNQTLQLNVTLTALSAANGQLGPIVVLQDADGTQLRYAWYGQSPGTLVLTNPLSAGTVVAAGTTPGFDFSHVAFFQIQLDPGSFSGTYTAAWNDASIVGCQRSLTDTGICASINTFDYSGLNGFYGSWTSGVYTETNFQVTATGWGGGWGFVSPAASVTADKTLQLNVTLTAPSAANGRLGPIVVLEDGDATQLQYAWYGQSPGTNLVLTSPLSAGVIVQAGNTPGFDFSRITAFHLQLDPSSFAGAYTVAWNDLSIIGCAPVVLRITSCSYDPASQQFSLTWASEKGAYYTVSAGTDLTSGFTDVLTDIPSGGDTTSVTITLSDPKGGFVRVRKQ